VISDSFFLFNNSTLTEGKKVFINLTQEILVREYIFLIPKQFVVVEILENVDPDSEVIAACHKGVFIGLCKVWFPDFVGLTENAFSNLLRGYPISFVLINLTSPDRTKKKATSLTSQPAASLTAREYQRPCSR
jgi:c-di-GMP-related signal transduction protein